MVEVAVRGDMVLVLTDPKTRMGFAFNTVRGVRSAPMMVDILLKLGYWDPAEKSEEEVAMMTAAPQVDQRGVPIVEQPMQEALLLEHLPGQHDQASQNPHGGGGGESAVFSHQELKGDLNASPFIDSIKKSGGFTFKAQTGVDDWGASVVKIGATNVTAGFAVARNGFASSIDKAAFDASPEAARAFIETWLDSEKVVQALSDPNMHVGGWFDADKGIVTLDVSEVHQDMTTALAAATSRGEKGIYNLLTGETIYTGKEGNQ